MSSTDLSEKTLPIQHCSAVQLISDMPHTGEAENAFLKSNSVSILTWVVKDDSSFTEVVLGFSPAEGRQPGEQKPTSCVKNRIVICSKATPDEKYL